MQLHSAALRGLGIAEYFSLWKVGNRGFSSRGTADSHTSAQHKQRRRGPSLLRDRHTVAIAALVNDPSQAHEFGVLEIFEQVRLSTKKRSGRSWELPCATSLARLRYEHGRSAEARECLQDICDRFTEGYGTADLRAATGLLEQLS